METPAKARYRDFCRTAPDVPVFAQAWYLDACARGGDWEVVLVEEDNRVVAALPYFYKQKGPFRYVTMPPFVKWLGPYLLPEFRGVLKKEHLLLEELIRQLPNFAAFKQNFYPTAVNWLPFYWQKFHQTTYYTYRLHGLQQLAQVEAGINRNIRRNIQKAQQQVRVVHDLSAEQFYKLNKMSFDRQGLPMPYSWAQFEQHDAALATNGARQMFFAVDAQERIHSAAYLIWDQQAAYYHLSGDNPALRESGAGILLIWEAIRYASEVLGLDCFDFEGSMLPAVERIRVQFGAVQTPYFFVWKYNSRAFELLEKLKP
ncbi:GNAT family N-acetyltransferase [Hymenobacter sp. BT683]|uniref:GNAT family N-acetyltransferase n=1 Tax=Hymenobacter jeongseonensis TaxID=2791027 RepID=A0ABS0IFJ3_9BACT|nr:GNAT family N-acetyltransferase [Hymenobacter jeongseonensis]MBF9236693.1 GNAT family N-acetyltransferase [Hymenobacter jeongseonensis]